MENFEAEIIEEVTIKQEPNDSGCVKVENFSDSDILNANTHENDVKPYIQFFENDQRRSPVKEQKKSDFMPVLCQIFENSDPRTTKLPLFEFKVADNFFFYMFEKISLQHFQNTNTFELTCAAFPNCRCRFKIEALITTDFTNEIFSKNRNWSIVPPKRKSKLIQSHICKTDKFIRNFPKLAKVRGQNWSIRFKSKDIKVSQDMYILSLEKISDTAGHFLVNHNGKNKIYVLNLRRALPALLWPFRIDCTEKGYSSPLRVFAVETVDPNDATFWSPQNWKVKANLNKKIRKDKILPRVNNEKESNSRKICSDSELDRTSLNENFFEFIKKSRGRPKGARGGKRPPRFRLSNQKDQKRAKNIALEKKLNRVSNETQEFSRHLRSKAKLRLTNKILDREIYSESDLDHVEISEDFKFSVIKNIPQKRWAWLGITNHYPRNREPEYDQK